MRRTAWYVSNTLLALLFLAPIFSALTVALSPPSELVSAGGSLWPAHPTLENFHAVWTKVPFLKWYLNSFRVAALFTVGQLISTSLTGFALARLRFPGRGVMMVVVLATMMLPFQAIMVPLFILMKNLGWLDSTLPLWVPAFFGDITGAFGIFLLRQGFMGIPASISEAAVVDGANLWQVFARIYLPLAKPYLAVVTVFSFMNSWNDFIRPIIYVTDQNRITVTGGLSYFQTAWHVEWGPMMAGTVLSMVPTLLLYVVAQRYFVEAVTSSGVKG